MVTVFVDESDPRLAFVALSKQTPLPRRKEVAVYCEGPNWLESVTEIPQPRAGLLIAHLLGRVGDQVAREVVTDFFNKYPTP